MRWASARFENGSCMGLAVIAIPEGMTNLVAAIDLDDGALRAPAPV